jgi:hypothetical protein
MVIAGGALLLVFTDGDRDVLRVVGMKGLVAARPSLGATLPPPMAMGLRGA